MGKSLAVSDRKDFLKEIMLTSQQLILIIVKFAYIFNTIIVNVGWASFDKSANLAMQNPQCFG